MTTEEKAKAYGEALEQAKRELNTCGSLDCDAARQIFRFFPQLKESEDERIRKGLIKLLTVASEAYLVESTGIKKDSYLAYLEKQKDSFENGRQLGIMQEQARQELGWPDEKKKEHQNNSDAPEKALGRDLISPKDKDKNLDEIAQDYVDGVKEYNPEPTWDLIQTAVCYGYHYCEQKEQKPAEWNANDKAFIKDCARILDENFYTESAERLLSMFPVKPAEWSEEDEMMLSSIIETLKYTNGAANMKIDWLKSLRPQPKQEWSDEDEHRRKDAIYFLESAKRHYADTSEIEKTIAWLKSLRSSRKPSEWNKEDKNRHYYLCNLLRETWDKVDKGSCIDDAISWLEELPTRVSLSSWKPTEEQMNAIDRCVDYLEESDNEDAEIMESLQEQLHKLM